MTTPTHDVIGIGNAIVDVIARIDDGVLVDQDLPKGSMNLVDEFRSSAIYGALGETTERSGGSAANTIAAMGALGRSAAFIGKVRDDEFGRIFRHDIRATGTAFESPEATTGEATARCMVMVTPDAERTMATYLGIAGDLGPDDVDTDAVADAGILYLEGYLYDKDAAKEAFRVAVEAAHGAGRKVALSLSDSFCVDRHRADFRAFVKDGTDILFANEAELLSLYETDDFDAATEAAAKDVEIAALTRSEKGAVIIANGERHEIPAYSVAALVHTTGAGDLFAAGFLNGVATGRTPEVCGRMGCAAANVVIQLLGARCSDALKAKFAIEGWTG